MQQRQSLGRSLLPLFKEFGEQLLIVTPRTSTLFEFTDTIDVSLKRRQLTLEFRVNFSGKFMKIYLGARHFIHTEEWISLGNFNQ